MAFVRRCFSWMFGPRKPSAGWWQVILWWEIRRIPYNIVVGGWGIVCLIVFYIAIEAAGGLKPGEDAVEPLALMFAPFAINACYTLGWLVELPLRAVFPGTEVRDRLGPRLMKLGVGLSLFAASLPAVLWVAIWLAGSLHPPK